MQDNHLKAARTTQTHTHAHASTMTRMTLWLLLLVVVTVALRGTHAKSTLAVTGNESVGGSKKIDPSGGDVKLESADLLARNSHYNRARSGSCECDVKLVECDVKLVEYDVKLTECDAKLVECAKLECAKLESVQPAPGPHDRQTNVLIVGVPELGIHIIPT